MESTNLKYAGNGSSSIVFKTPENSALNVFYTRPIKKVQKIFDRLSFAYEKGIKVPKPIKLSTKKLKEKDLEGISFFGKLKIWQSQIQSMPIIGGELPVIEREFIPGTSLNKFLLPKSKVRRKTKEILRNLKKEKLGLWELSSDSFVLTPENEVFLVDFEPLYLRNSNDPHPRKYLIDKLKSIVPPVCIPEEILYGLGYFLTHPVPC